MIEQPTEKSEIRSTNRAEAWTEGLFRHCERSEAIQTGFAASLRSSQRRLRSDHRHRPLAEALDRGGVDARRGDEHAEGLARGGVEGERLAERAGDGGARLLADQGGG